MDALSATSLALLGSPPRRRDTVALLMVGALAVATALVCLAVAWASDAPGDREGFGAVGLALLVWLSWRVWGRRVRATGRLTIAGDGLVASDPHILREPLRIPHASLRAAVVERDDRAERRFRVHAASGPFWGGERDGWLWERGTGSAVPALMREERDEPNVALVLEPPVAVPALRGRRSHRPLAGERLAGLLLRVDDPAAAEEALDRLGVLRPLTVPDALVLADGLGWGEEAQPAPPGSRRALLVRRTQRTGWLLLAAGVVFPLGGLCAALAGLTLWQGGRRRHGATLMVGGAIVCAIRTATIVL